MTISLHRILSHLNLIKHEKNNFVNSNDHPLFSGSIHAEPDPDFLGGYDINERGGAFRTNDEGYPVHGW